MSSVPGSKGADFEILASSSPTQCSDGSKRLTHTGSEESLEPDGDETGYINQTENNEQSSDTKNELESATEDLGKSTLSSLPSKSSDENVTTTAPVVLIPAIKGSREKHGLTLRKTSVSWAADVYDPPPSIASHTRNKKQQQQQQQKSKSKDSHRKNGKKGHKGKDSSNSSRSGKDKKQASSRKHSRDKFDWVTQMPIVAASS